MMIDIAIQCKYKVFFYDIVSFNRSKGCIANQPFHSELADPTPSQRRTLPRPRAHLPSSCQPFCSCNKNIVVSHKNALSWYYTTTYTYLKF